MWIIDVEGVMGGGGGGGWSRRLGGWLLLILLRERWLEVLGGKWPLLLLLKLNSLLQVLLEESGDERFEVGID